MKKLASLILLLTLSVGIVAPKKADAMVGVGLTVAGAGAGVMIACGLGFSLAGGMLFTAAVMEDYSHPDEETLFLIATGSLLAFGLIMLDEQGTSFEYGELSNEVAGKAGLTLEEHKAFNRSVPEFNAVMEEVYHEVLAQYGQREDATVSEVINTSENLWQEYSSNFAPVEQSALKKYRAFLGNLELSVQ